MTLKLVSDNTVEPIPIGNLADISGMARRFAAEVDAGARPGITRVTLLIEGDAGLSREAWGAIPSGYELIGIFETAKLAVIAAGIED